MTTITLVIGADTVSDDVVRGRVAFEENAGVGNAEVILLDESGEWLGDFIPHESFTLSVDGAVIFTGYVEDTEPYIDPEFTAIDMIRVTAVDYGFDLQRLYLTADYELGKDDDTVDAALSAAGAEVTYASASAGTEMSYSFKRTYLSEGFREIADERGKCFYVAQDKALHWFLKNAAAEYLDGGGGRPDVDLILNAEDTGNNVLDFRRGETNGSKLFNYVELVAGPLMDHWTEMNASDWAATAGKGTVSNAYSTQLTDYLVGRAAIKVSRADSGTLEITLDIGNGGSGRYEYTSLDLSRSDSGSVFINANYLTVDGLAPSVRIRLRDTTTRWIEFRRHIPLVDEAPLHNRTDYLPVGDWVKLNFPYGNGAPVVASYGSNEQWYYLGGAVAFDWAHVDRIQFSTDFTIPQVDTTVGVAGGYFIIDGLTLPTVEVKSIDSDPTSIGTYGKRMYTKQRPDVRSQVELDGMIGNFLVKQKDPLETLSLTIIGNTNLLYPSQTLQVQAVPKGIAALTKYRIVKLSHKFWSKRYRERDDRDFITEVDLISQSVLDDSLRRAWNVNPSSAALRQLKYGQTWAERYERSLESEAPIGDYPMSAGTGIIASGATFPTTPAPNQLFYLTAAVGADPVGYYRWDEGTTDWILVGSALIDSLSGNISVNQIAANTINANMINANAVTSDKINANAVIAGKIAANAVTADTILAGAVIAGKIGANAIYANNVVAGEINVDHLAANAVTANKIQANAITTNKILAQQVSIDKLATNIATANGVQFLFVKLSEYTRALACAADGGDLLGANIYTRTVLNETTLLYKVRQIEAELKTDHATFAKGYLTVFAQFNNTPDVGFFDTQDPQALAWAISQTGVGSYDFTIANQDSFSYRQQGRVVSRVGAGTHNGFEVYKNLAAPLDLSNYVEVHIFLGSVGQCTGGVRVILSTDATYSDFNNYYYYDITDDLSAADYTTIVLDLADFTAVGTPAWNNINSYGFGNLTQESGTEYHAINLCGFSFTKCHAVVFDVAATTYAAFNEGDDGLFTLAGAKNQTCKLYYYLGVWNNDNSPATRTVYCQYPASDIRGVSYLEAV